MNERDIVYLASIWHRMLVNVSANTQPFSGTTLIHDKASRNYAVEPSGSARRLVGRLNPAFCGNFDVTLLSTQTAIILLWKERIDNIYHHPDMVEFYSK